LSEEKEVADRVINEYKQVKVLLEELPKEVRHQTKIQLGPRAFIPGAFCPFCYFMSLNYQSSLVLSFLGYLQHTNELMVHLGSNYFVESSAFQVFSVCPSSMLLSLL
jgi:prefoldin subunit 5